MRRSLVAGCVIGAVALLAPLAQAQTTAQCLADHTGDAPVLLRGRLAAERTVTATTLRQGVAAGTLTGRTITVNYLSGATPNTRTYTGVPLYEAMTKLVEPLFGTTIRNIGLRYFLSVTAVDGCRVLIAWGDIDPFFGNRSDILLAYDERNDDANETGFHTLSDVGPRLLVPEDIRGGRYASCVRDIRLASADDSDGLSESVPTVQGSPGAAGVTGPAGATGATGARGADGSSAAAATCRLTSAGVRCRAPFVAPKARARLTRLGKTAARGTISRLATVGRLERGKAYTLRLASGGSARVILG